MWPHIWHPPPPVPLLLQAGSVTMRFDDLAVAVFLLTNAAVVFMMMWRKLLLK
jgi:hypothetical protein